MYLCIYILATWFKIKNESNTLLDKQNKSVYELFIIFNDILGTAGRT